MSEIKQQLIGDLICILIGGVIGTIITRDFVFGSTISFVVGHSLFAMLGAIFIGGIYFGGRFITKYVVAVGLWGLLAIVVFCILFGWVCCPIYLIADIIAYKKEKKGNL